MDSGRFVTVPNLLTALRLTMTIFAAALFFVWGMEGAGTAICIAVAVLDALDGWAARRLDQVTAVGAYLDPAVDKMMATLVFGTIAVKMGNSIVWGLFAMVLARDLAVTIYRSASLARRGRCVAASRISKIKTGIQNIGGLTALGYLVWLSDGEPITAAPVVVVLGVVTVLSYLSAWKYGVFLPKRQ